MRTAYCFTPDRAFFAPAVRAIASLIEAEPDVEREIFLVCEPEDVPAGFDRLQAPLRNRIELVTLDFAGFDKNLKTGGRFSRAVFRRLFFDEILPAHFERIVSIDSDMLIVRPGLAKLESFELGGRPLAAAYDMIFLMDFKRDALARRFQTYRRSLGLDLETPYFNAGPDGDRPRRMAQARADRARGQSASRHAGALSVHGAGRAQRDAQRRFRASLAALQFHGRLFPARPRAPDRTDRAAFRQRAEALGARALARRSAVRRRLPRLVLTLSLAGAG